jgi:hypothetical protein
MNYIELSQAIQAYSENTESLFVENIPRFIMEAESRIYNSVQLPSLRKNVTGNISSGVKYLALPDDWLSTYSIAVISSGGSYSYLLNKDVNFIREAYPNPNSLGQPKYYAIFGSRTDNANELTAIIGPTPDAAYNVELHYFYYPVSIVQSSVVSLGTITPGINYTNGVYFNVPLTGGSGEYLRATVVVNENTVVDVTITNGGSLYTEGDVLTADSAYIGGSGTGFSTTVASVSNSAGTSWLGDNYDPVLFYGAMREAMLFMKGEQDLVGYYEQKYQEALSQLKRLGDGLERGDAYRDGQTKLKVNS